MPDLTRDDIERLPYRSCAGIMLVNERGGVFVGQRLDFVSDAWQMPQGGVEPGETPEAAALRELGEETGLRADLARIEAQTDDWITYDLPPDLVPRLWHGRYRGQRQKWFLMRFLGTDADINIATQIPEFSRWQWLAPDALVEHIVPFKRQVYRQVLDCFGDNLRG